MRTAPFILASLVLVGCGAKTEPEQTSAAKTAEKETPNVDTSKFTMTIPEEWLALNLEKMDAAAVKEKLKGTVFAPRAPDLEKMRSAINFFAFDPSMTKGQVFANMNVLLLPAGGSASDVIKANLETMKKMDPKSQELKGLTNLPDSTAISYTMMGMDMIGVITIQQNQQIVITYTAPKGAGLEKMKAIVAPIANSFKLK